MGAQCYLIEMYISKRIWFLQRFVSYKIVLIHSLMDSRTILSLEIWMGVFFIQIRKWYDFKSHEFPHSYICIHCSPIILTIRKLSRASFLLWYMCSISAKMYLAMIYITTHINTNKTKDNLMYLYASFDIFCFIAMYLTWQFWNLGQ